MIYPTLVEVFPYLVMYLIFILDIVDHGVNAGVVITNNYASTSCNISNYASECL